MYRNRREGYWKERRTRRNAKAPEGMFDDHGIIGKIPSLTTDPATGDITSTVPHLVAKNEELRALKRRLCV